MVSHSEFGPRLQPYPLPTRLWVNSWVWDAGEGAGDVEKSFGGARRAPSTRIGPRLPHLPPLQPLLQEEPRLAERQDFPTHSLVVSWLFGSVLV